MVIFFFKLCLYHAYLILNRAAHCDLYIYIFFKNLLCEANRVLIFPPSKCVLFTILFLEYRRLT